MDGDDSVPSTPSAFLAKLRSFVKSTQFTEFVRQGNAIVGALAQALDPWEQALRGAATQLAEFAASDGFARFVQAINEGNKWMVEAPEKLKLALASEGVVPHPSALSLSDLRDLTDVFDAHGSRAAAELLFRLHEKLLGMPKFRVEVEERWRRRGRWQVFSEVLTAYDAKLYALAIPPALAQAEGIVAHLFGLKGMKFPLFKQKVAELHDEDFDIFGPLATSVLEGLLEKFHHGEPVAKLNRHAVLHGADSSYGTRENAIAAIIWADYIMCAAEGYKAVATPKPTAASITELAEPT